MKKIIGYYRDCDFLTMTGTSMALLGIVFIIQGYMHMANLYNGTYGPLGEEFTFVINVKGILYIIVYALFAICSGLELFIQRKK